MIVVSEKDKKRNDDIRQMAGVACITGTIHKARLKWYGQVQRREDNNCIKRIMTACMCVCVCVCQPANKIIPQRLDGSLQNLARRFTV